LKNLYQAFIVFLISSLLLLVFYSQVIFNPSDYISSESGDGIKNYYSLLYHIQHDSTYAHIEGMHYPYGEVHLFADGQPSIANPLKWLKNNTSIDSTSWAVAIVNLLMLFSIALSSVFLFFIFKKLHLNFWFSVFGAVCISFLAPQVFRIPGHLGLAYSFFIPLTWLLYLKYKESKSAWLYSFLLFVSLLFYVFIHPYLGMIAGVFLFLFHFLDNLFDKKFEFKNYRVYLHIFVQAILPLLIFQIITKNIDFHLGRTSTPWGMFFYNARFESILLPHHSPFKNLFELFFPIRGQNWEGWSYIGMSGVFMLILFFIRIKRAFSIKRFRKIYYPNFPSMLRIIPLASLLILIFSTAIVFKLMPFTLDSIPFLKQFRGLGRFSWLFYYMALVYAVYLAFLIFRYFKIKNLKLTANTFISVFFFLMIVEFVPYHQELKEVFVKNQFKEAYLDTEIKELINNVDISQYQAAISLPFYHIGSENFTKEGTHKILKSSFLFSYYTSLPFVSASIARTSIPEAKNIMQIFSPDYIPKEIKNDFKSDKKILIFHSKEGLNKYEKTILDKSKILYENNAYLLAEIEKNELFQYDKEKYLEEFKILQDTLPLNSEGFSTNRRWGYFLYDDFEKTGENFEASRVNGKCKTMNKGDSTVIWTMPKGELGAFVIYKASLWFYNDEESLQQCHLVLREKSPGMKKFQDTYKTSILESMVIDGKWTLVELYFDIKNENNEVELVLKGEKFPKQIIKIDNFCIQEAHANHYKKINNRLIFFNNYLIETGN
jgi:hypothetical protein